MKAFLPVLITLLWSLFSCSPLAAQEIHTGLQRSRISSLEEASATGSLLRQLDTLYNGVPLFGIKGGTMEACYHTDGKLIYLYWIAPKENTNKTTASDIKKIVASITKRLGKPGIESPEGEVIHYAWKNKGVSATLRSEYGILSYAELSLAQEEYIRSTTSSSINQHNTNALPATDVSFLTIRLGMTRVDVRNAYHARELKRLDSTDLGPTPERETIQTSDGKITIEYNSSAGIAQSITWEGVRNYKGARKAFGRAIMDLTKSVGTPTDHELHAYFESYGWRTANKYIELQYSHTEKQLHYLERLQK